MPEQKLTCFICKKEKKEKNFSKALRHINYFNVDKYKSLICNKCYPRPAVGSSRKVLSYDISNPPTMEILEDISIDEENKFNMPIVKDNFSEAELREKLNKCKMLWAEWVKNGYGSRPDDDLRDIIFDNDVEQGNALEDYDIMLEKDLELYELEQKLNS